jgi:hypothetical protein
VLHALLQNFGPIGDVVDWILAQAADVSALAWRTLVESMQLIGRSVDEVLAFAQHRSEQMLRAVAAAIEEAGMVVSQVIGWAVTAGDRALAIVGEVLVKAGNTVDGILLWVGHTAVDKWHAIINGMLSAGAAVVDFVAWMADRGVQVIKGVTAELIGFGVSIATLVADMLAHPGNALRDLMKALDELGRTLKELVQVAIVQPTEDAARRALQALKDIGKSAVEILKAAVELPLSKIALLFAIILDWFPGTYRPLTDIEHAEAASVFGKSIDLDKVKLAVKSLPVDLIETLNHGRTFTTMYLINFASWDKVDLDTLIHELTHVWQGLLEGPVYMIEALEAQLIGKGYNYGYKETFDGNEYGDGGEDNLAAAGGNFGHFNQEQQAQIIMHYHARKTATPPRDLAAWQPYANVVFA